MGLLCDGFIMVSLWYSFAVESLDTRLFCGALFLTFRCSVFNPLYRARVDAIAYTPFVEFQLGIRGSLGFVLAAKCE